MSKKKGLLDDSGVQERRKGRRKEMMKIELCLADMVGELGKRVKMSGNGEDKLSSKAGVGYQYHLEQ